MKRMASIFAAVMAIATLATVRSAFGADIATVVSNATDVTVNEATLASGEALYVYTTTGTDFNFTLEKQSKVWLLVVGGGGAGGYGVTASTEKGEGGGGGAGGFVEATDAIFVPGTYTINVGAGGVRAASATGTPTPAGDSYIKLGGEDKYLAEGGGSGAAAGAGVGGDGGSGGGGSYDGTETEAKGGSAVSGKGNAGGKGLYYGGGGGGGGAGAGGVDTPASNRKGGAGGDGKESSITGSAVVYAGGGGGGTSGTAATRGAGGAGGGGTGGGTTSSTVATAGTDGLGGGGGGGGTGGTSTTYRRGANGGSGIVIIRVKKIMGEITPPVSKDLPYTGTAQNIWPDYDPSDCDLTAGSDSLTQKAVGTYSFGATPKDGAVWKGTGSSETTNITWRIVKATDNFISLSQDGWVEGSPVAPVVSWRVTDNPSEPTILYSNSADGEYTPTVPTAPGTYFVKATIAETDNYASATAGPVQFKILGATDSPNPNLGFFAPVTFPSYTGSGTVLIEFTLNPFQYGTKDNETSGLCVCSANGDVYPQTVVWKDGGVATITVEIDNMSSTKQVFLCWGLVEGGTEPVLSPSYLSDPMTPPPSVGTHIRDKSKTLKNYIKGLAMPSWRVGETPSEPSYRYKVGNPVVRYVDSANNESAEKPTTPGAYTLTVSIPAATAAEEFGPYSGVSTNISFKILAADGSPIVGLKYFSQVTASIGLLAGVKKVKVPSSHDWVANYNDGTDVRFCDINGNIYPSALSAWNGDGSAVFNVELPDMSVGDKFYMCWGETVGTTIPEAAEPMGTPVTPTFAIGSAVADSSQTLKNWIRDLKMRGFRLGDSPTVPTSVSKIGTVKYQYSLFQTASFLDYDPLSPPEPGVYYMRAVVEAADGYAGAVSEEVLVTVKFRVLGATESPIDSLAWFAPVTATGNLDSPASVGVTLPASLDYRTIYNDGSDIRFCDADGNILPSARATAWATDGSTKFNVEIPAFATSFKFYMCWGPIVGMTIPATRTLSLASSEVIVAVGAAVRDETKLPLVNHWVSSPVFPSAWAIGDTVSYTPGDPAYGTFKLLCRDTADASGALTEITELPNSGGDFELIACADAGDYYAGITNVAFDVSVSKHDPSMSLTRFNGAEGRVLLMNADLTPGAEVYNQGYADNDPSYDTYWEHLMTVALPTAALRNNYNISNETMSILRKANGGSRLWTLINCRQGNVFRKLDTQALAATQNFLPWDSPNARDIDSHESTAHTRHGAGQIIMQNTTNACVYSSCFEEGIGTIYFDAVNSGRITTALLPEAFQLKVSVATDCITSLGEVVDIAPTDEYVRDFDETEPEPDEITTNVNWRVVSVVPVKVTNGVIDSSFAQVKTDTVSLDIDVGGTDNNFYRIISRLDIKQPARFKIERVSVAEGNADVITCYILLDNIVVSYPAMRAEITTFGNYDPEKKGKRVVGQQAALNEVFPSVGSTGLLGRGKVTYLTNAGIAPEILDTANFITSARFNYRWRYLNQSFYHDGVFSTVDDGKFASVRLSKADNYTVSTRALDLPGLPGDIEYWYELALGAPYYKYVDYSGLNVGVGDYSEEEASIESHFDVGDAHLPSGGTNWFVRIREGASSFEKVVLAAREPDGDSWKEERIDMDLVGDHLWRGFVIVTNKSERNLSFYITGVNKQVDGETEYVDDASADFEFRAREELIDISNGPYSGVLAEVGEEAGYRARVHYLTNVASYIEFQFNDDTRAISISHADWQDFNTWFSSRWENDSSLKFYSSAHETNSTTLATKRYPAKNSDGSAPKLFESFDETPRTATGWSEDFSLKGSQSLSPEGFWMNRAFSSERTPNGWLADQGMWVSQYWGITNYNNFALQMEGRGKGSVTFNLTPAPNGLDTITFKTRLAQFSDFEDVSFSWENIMRKNYTVAAQACFDADASFSNFSGEGSVSLFAGYVPNRGGYEYRITIYNLESPGENRACVRHALYKWSVKGGRIVPEQLAEVSHANSDGWYWTTGTTRKDRVANIPLGLNNGAYSGMFMSISNDSGKVIITAGVSKNPTDKKQLAPGFVYDTTFMQLGCVDTSPATTHGTYGVSMKNCPGRVLYPRVYNDATVPIPTGSGVKTVGKGSRWEGTVALLGQSSGYTPERSTGENKLADYWGLRAGRIEEFQQGAVWGLVASTNTPQKVGVYIMPVGSSDNWECLTNVAVSTFNNGSHSIVLQSTKPCNVKFASAAAADDLRTDVIIDDIVLTQWCGQEAYATTADSGYGYYNDFYCTGTWVSNHVSRVGSTTTTRKVALLAPRRAESAKTPVGIRSPYLEGFGAFFFSYRDAGEGAELWLQRWVGGGNNLYGHLGDSADAPGWEKLATWTFRAGESGTKSFYLGQRAPSNGVFRLVIPQTKVATAYAHKEYDANWAAVTITDVYCYDEPELDLHSWWGWNFLTTGWKDGAGNKYAAIDDHDDGAVGMLNNTLATSSLKTGDKDDYDKNDPFIQSPTFNGRNIGEISFRARRYSSSDSVPSYVTVWGAKSGELSKASSWTAITNFVVDTVAYTRYTAKCAYEDGYRAIRLGVANVPGILEDYTMEPASEPEYPASPARVLIDEVVIRERVRPEVGFRLDYVRPFRLGLSELTAVGNIASRDQQPLLGEQFGFQAEVEVTGLADEVDLSRTPVVTLSYYPKAEPWGYSKWKDAEGAVLDIELEPAEGTNLVFRSTSAKMSSFAGPFEKDDAEEVLGYRVVQYFLTVKYWDKGGGDHVTPISEMQWRMPSWYYGFVDPNEKADAAFSPFTVLDTVSPGRAWFNEINFSDENGDNANQFVEVCFPAGYDMTGWSIYRYDVWGYNDLLASFGLTEGVRETKAATGGDPDFAFFALTSANKPVAGADANWSGDAASCGGTDSYGFQLVRPSGIIEQQIVVQGKLGSGRYSNNKLGTNVVAQLSQLVGGEWNFVSADTNTATRSSGVFQNVGSDPDDWNDTMDMTPGHLNGGQTIPVGWFLPPSGTNVWVSLTALGDRVWIVDGENRSAATSFVIPLNATTNILFETAPWHQLDSLMRDVTNDVASAAVRSAGTGGTNRWTYAFKETEKNSATLQASARPSDEVLERGALDRDDPYAPAIMNWLVGGVANGLPFEGTEISTNCFFYKGFTSSAARFPLPLKDRYWLDIDPTSDDWDLHAGMGEVVPTVPVAQPVRRKPAVSAYWPEPVTNRVFAMSMMISNKTNHALSRPPNRLQGLGGEKSDVVGPKNWTSETFKVMMSLIKPDGADGIDVRDRYWPLAQFVFDSGSFGAPDGPHPFAARVEVLDPMSPSSSAYSHGWWKYPNSSYGYKFDLSHGIYMQTPGMLNATNTWDKAWEVHDEF